MNFAAPIASDSFDDGPKMSRTALKSDDERGQDGVSRSHLPGHLAGLTVWRQVIAIAIWPLLEQLLGFCVGLVDTAIAGRLSVEATEAIAVAAYVGWLLVLLFGAVGVGASALVSRAIGGRHRTLANAALGQAIVLAVVLSIIVATLLYATAALIGALMNLTGEAQEMAAAYLRVIALAAPAHSVLFVSAACLRASGDTRTPFRILAIVNVVNVLASLLFVFGPAPLGGHGIIGIAAGTAVAWIVGAALVMRTLLSGRSPIRLRWFRLRPQASTLTRIFRISAPQFVDSLVMWTGNFLVASIVGYIGRTMQSGALGAHVIVIRIEALSYLPGWALAVAAATLTGQYLGLGDPARSRQATYYCWILAVFTMGFMGLLFLTIPHALVRLITSEPLLLEITPPLLRICGPVQIFLGTAMVLDQALRGAGDTRMATILVASSTMFVRLPAAYVVGLTFSGGVSGVWIAICAEIVFRALLAMAYYSSGRWSRVSV